MYNVNDAYYIAKLTGVAKKTKVNKFIRKAEKLKQFISSDIVKIFGGSISYFITLMTVILKRRQGVDTIDYYIF